MIEVKQEFSSLIPLLAPDEYKQLEANCISEGIREPLIVWDGVIIDGHNRYKIAQEHNLDYKTINKEFESQEAAKEWMILNQFGRRNLSAYQRSVLALQLEDVFRAKAKEKQKESGGAVPSKSTKPPVDTREELAKIASVGGNTISKVKKLQEKAPQEIKDKLATGEMSINQAYQEVKREEKKGERDRKIEGIKARIEQNNSISPDKKYHVIAVDPPWAYSERGGFSSADYDANSNRGAVDYPVMGIEQISAIELPADDDCVLFLWTTHHFLEDSFNILKCWGFEYKATLVWDKVKMGIGRTIRMQIEFCLLAVKGQPMISGSSERDIITEPRREHSRKPEAFYEMVDRMCIGNKLDYFSRQTRENWDHYGAEQGRF